MKTKLCGSARAKTGLSTVIGGNKLFRDVFLFSAVVVEALSKTTENSDFVHSEPVFEEGWIWKGDHKLTVKTSSCKRF
jgi:hypothetical protein